LISIGILSQAIVNLEANPLPASMQDAKGLFKYITPEMKYPQRLILSNLWLFESVVVRYEHSSWLRMTIISALSKSKATNSILRTTTAVTIFKAGEKENVLPSKATAMVNFRVAPKDTIASVVEHVKKVINDDRVTVSIRSTTPLYFFSHLLDELEAAPVTRDDTPIFNTLHNTIKQSK
jgi:carboxypeptidase PM20D1